MCDFLSLSVPLSTILDYFTPAMFVPGLFTGKLIELISAVKVAFLGCLIYVFAGLSFASGNEMWNYVPGMALLGLGWNFSFTSSTLMLTDCYRPVEALQVQAFNDFVIFSVSGISTLIAGVIYNYAGWEMLIYISWILMLCGMVMFSIAQYMIFGECSCSRRPRFSPSPSAVVDQAVP